MKTFVATVKFVDVRDILIEADTIEEAQEKYNSGNWASEDTISFYIDEELSPLKETIN